MAAIPADVTLICPREKILRLFISIDGGLNYRCSGCEWPFVLAVPTIAAPSVPASTVAATNTSGSIIAVTISGGTLTFVFVNGTQVGTTAGTYLVPIGGTISITYSVAPAWTWQQPVTNGTIAVGGTSIPVASGGTYPVVGQTLFIDSATNPEILTVAAGSTGTSIAIQPAARSHASAVSFGTAVPTPAVGAVDTIPANPGYGF